MRPRGCGCFSTLIILVLLLVICVGLGWFVGMPRIRDGVANSIEDGISTEVAGQLDSLQLGAGTYPLPLASIADQVNQQLDSAGIDNVVLYGDGQRIYLGLTSQGSEATYSGIPTVKDGKLVMDDMTGSNKVLEFVIPADRLGGAIESGVNTYLEQQGLRLTDVWVDNDTLMISTEPAT